MGPPFGLPLEQARKLTRQQVLRLYLCPRDRKGLPIEPEEMPSRTDQRQRWQQLYRGRGLAEHRIEHLLRERFGG